MPYPTCSHYKDDGVVCGSPALQDGKYCYVHTRQLISAIYEARAERLRSPDRLDLPRLADPRTIQRLLSQIAAGLGDYSIDCRRADAMHYAIRLASKELRRPPRPKKSSVQPVANEYFTRKLLTAKILRKNSPQPHENEEF